MKKLIGLLALILFIISSCSKDNLRSELDESFEKWEDFKKASGNSYYYKVTSSSWTGFSSVTTLVVKDGIVRERVYESYSVDGSNGVKTLTDTWIEYEINLDTHLEGAEALTMDQVYAKAKNVWLKADKEKNTIYFENKNEGMISSCGFVPLGCMDDCFNGISISAIRPLADAKYIR